MTKDAVFNPKLKAALSGQQKEPGYDEWLQEKVEKGLEDIRAGRFVSQEEVEAEFATRHATGLIG